MSATKQKKKPLKIYTLYGSPGGSLSAKTSDYLGELMNVAAVSIKQAYYFAGNNKWAESPENPAGIVEYYRREAGAPGDHFLWCGCRIFGGLAIKHQSSAAATRKAMAKHLASAHATGQGATQGATR